MRALGPCRAHAEKCQVTREGRISCPDRRRRALARGPPSTVGRWGCRAHPATPPTQLPLGRGPGQRRCVWAPRQGTRERENPWLDSPIHHLRDDSHPISLYVFLPWGATAMRGVVTCKKTFPSSPRGIPPDLTLPRLSPGSQRPSPLSPSCSVSRRLQGRVPRTDMEHSLAS